MRFTARTSTRTALGGFRELAKAKAFPWQQSLSVLGGESITPPPASVKTKEANGPKVVHTVRDLAQPNSRFFLKSEWGPISLEWPALSFSKRSVGDYLHEEYNPARDFIVYAGTGNANRTKEAEFGSKRLLSVLITEPSQPIPTEDIVPWESWQRALTDHGKVWPLIRGSQSMGMYRPAMGSRRNARGLPLPRL